MELSGVMMAVIAATIAPDHKIRGVSHRSREARDDRGSGVAQDVLAGPVLEAVGADAVVWSEYREQVLV